ncbi:hypothetical protein PQX77_016732 [Marasmius sp. AFHP31]|nr:hypothetical protein PQX77_016732 [Marasmius sp. AFHP31]
MSQASRSVSRAANVEHSGSSASTARPLSSVSTVRLSHSSATINDGEEEEDEEDVDMDADIPPVVFELPETGALSEARVRKHIADLQTYGEAWREKAHELLVEIMELKARLAGSSRRGRKVKASSTRDAPYERDTVLRVGKQWCVFGSPWLDAGAFGVYPTNSMPHPQSPARFETTDSHLQGTIVQLHEFLGDDKLKEFAAENSQFRNEFIANISAQRLSGMTHIRNGVSSIFHGFSVNIPTEICHANRWQERANNTNMRRLLQPPPNAPGSGKSPLSVIFFPGQVYNMTQCFMNEIQPKIIRCVLFGPNSLEGGSVNRASSLGNIWGVTRVNGSAIAFSAVILQFLLNGDPTLEPIGGKTKTEYCKNFVAFQRLIEVSVGFGSPWAASLFKFYNDRVFKGHKSAMSPVEDDDPGLSQALLDLSLRPNPIPASTTDSSADAGAGTVPPPDESLIPDGANAGILSLIPAADNTSLGVPADDTSLGVHADNNTSLPVPVDENPDEGIAPEPVESRSPSPTLPEPADGGAKGARKGAGGGAGGATRGARGRGAVTADPPEILDSEPPVPQPRPKRSTRNKK